MQWHSTQSLIKSTQHFNLDPEKDRQNIKNVKWYVNNLPECFDWNLRLDYRTRQIVACKNRPKYFHAHQIPATEGDIETLLRCIIKDGQTKITRPNYSKSTYNFIGNLCKRIVEEFNCPLASLEEVEKEYFGGK